MCSLKIHRIKRNLYTHDNLLSASEITLCGILRRYCSVEGFGFNSHPRGTAEACNGGKLDESQVTYRIPLAKPEKGEWCQ